MPFVRISVMTARAGHEKEVSDLLDRLIALYPGHHGFITAYRLVGRGAPTSPSFGRLSMWEHEEDVRAMAAEQKDIAIQSQLKLITLEETHAEYAFEAIELKH